MEVATACSSELTPEEERLVIRDLTLAAQAHCKEGDIFYLIAHRWWQNWLEYVYQDPTNMSNSSTVSYGPQSHDSATCDGWKRPSVIDNTDLIYEFSSEVSNAETELHDTLAEGRDFILLPQEAWKQLHGWYGGGPTLSRKVISSGISQTELSVEVYPLRLQLLLEPKGEHAFIRISKKETVGELHTKACGIFDLISDQVSIWDYYGHQKHALMNSMEKTLDDCNIQMDQEILVEVLNDGTTAAYDGCLSYIQENGHLEKDLGSVITEPGRTSLPSAGGLSTCKNASRSCSSDLSQNQILGSPTSDLDNSHSNNNISMRGASVGLTGLLNLGNTCFMNSAIQCLVHTPEFARYFREDYRQEINWQNPLGMVGELALAFGELLRKLWAPGRTPVNPRPFKTKLARFAPQFSGYNQHDSQELLAFLLDGLHEDLNRVKHKPYIKTRDADGRPDEEVADEYWQNHIARNDSIIVDVCQGQYKSTLVCPVCGKVSVTFDPFMYLSLPLQFATARSMTVTVLTGDGSALPAPYTVSVPKHGRCKDLIQILGTACSLKVGEKLLLAEVRGHSVLRFLTDPLILLSTIKDDEHVVAYKIPNVESGTLTLQLIHQREERELNNSKAMVYKPFGTPLVTQVAIGDIVKKGDIQAIVRKMLSPMLRSEKAQILNDHKNSVEVAEPKCEVSSSEISMSEQDPVSSATYNLTLHLIDGTGGLVDLSTGEEEAIEVSSSSDSVVVYFSWSAGDFERYNTRCLENLHEVLKYGPPLKKTRSEPLSLYACLEAFLREEPLVPEDMWYCPQCKERRQASKKLDLWRLPEVLVIHLKRFSYSRSNKHKLETFVNFPIHDFDLTSYVANKNSSQRQLYELYALSNHYGNMASGHYTAHIKLLDENRWYNFDDNHIAAINEEEVKSPAAYVLFYRRVKDEDTSISYGAPCSLEQNHYSSRR